jgi:hypothetical protein
MTLPLIIISSWLGLDFALVALWVLLDRFSRVYRGGKRADDLWRPVVGRAVAPVIGLDAKRRQLRQQ